MLATPATAQVEWTAFNDLAPDGSDNPPNVTGHDYRAVGGSLRDFVTGDALPVTVSGTIVNGYDPRRNGVPTREGTDAAAAFGGVVDLRGIHELDRADWRNIVTFDGLDPTKRYTITLTANRGNRLYRGSRYTRVTLVGADELTQASSDGVVVYGEDAVSFGAGDNSKTGYVARWVDVTAADGQFSVVSQWDNEQGGGFGNTKGYAMAAFRLEQHGNPVQPCAGDAECADDNPCTDDRCDLDTGRCVHSANAAPCDDSVDCTTDDICANGECVPGVSDDTLCDDTDQCTDDLCHPGEGCRHRPNQAPCDDGVACTQADVCAQGQCAGANACPDGQTCSAQTGECAGAASTVAFTAYNDLAWIRGQLEANITRMTSPNGGSGLPSQGELVDFESGTGTGVTLEVRGGTYNGRDHAAHGGTPPPGSDAGEVFEGAVSTRGAISYYRLANTLDLVFTGLDPATAYTLVFYGDRGSYGWERASRVRLADVDAFVNESSGADDNPRAMLAGALYAGPDDPTVRLPASNPRGYVARFTGINPGADGTMVLEILADGASPYKGKYASAVMLQGSVSGPSGCSRDADCDDENVCTTDVCNLETSTCERQANSDPCSDDIACTAGDRCANGVCVGGVPNNALCDDQNVCTNDVCAPIAGGCSNAHNDAPCDDGVACTNGDVCAEGSCSGADGCPAGQACNADNGHCVGAQQSSLFRAYNDLAWAKYQPNHNITRITSPSGRSGLPSHGQLIDFETGHPVGAVLHVDGGWFNGRAHGSEGREAPADTDAAAVFDGAVSTRGSITYVNRPGNPLVLAFSELDPDLLYNIVYHGDRAKYGWNRSSQVTLAGAEAFVNESSAADDNPDPASGGAIFSGPDDDSTRLPADNSRGYVARFTSVAPGPDGVVVLVITADGGWDYRGKYASAVMLEAVAVSAVGCVADGDCADDNLCTDNVCDVGTGECQVTHNDAPCDDGVACTAGDHCAQGVCVGGAPSPDLCDDADACTDDVCDPGTGCDHVPNTGLATMAWRARPKTPAPRARVWAPTTARPAATATWSRASVWRAPP